MICKNKNARKFGLLIVAFLLFAPFSFLSAQTLRVEPKVEISTNKSKIKLKQKINRALNDSDSPAEKSIAVDARVNIVLQVCQGNLKINGWERKEIRAFVSGGSMVGFRVQQKDRQSQAPVLVTVLGFDPAKSGEADAEECLSGEEIELDVPRGSVVNVKGSETETTIDSVRKVSIEIGGGDIFLNNISEGINARTFEGGVTVGNSSGAMTLNTTTGNIVAYAVSPSEIGDAFSAKTNSGAIVLQKIEHRQTESVTISGSIKFVGEFQNGGQYGLRTQNGSILLALSEKSSFKLNASYGFGAFNTEIPLENLVKNNPTSRTQSISASLGKGEATLNLKTSSGAIRIRKQ